MAIEQEPGRGVPDGVAGVAAQAREQVQQAADEAKVEASARVREQLDTRSTQLGDQVTTFGQALRKAAEHLQGEGNDAGARAAHQAADRVEQLAGYLTGSSSDRFLGDVESFGRQRPWAAGAVGVALGFVGARFLKASSESRYDTSRAARRDADLPLSRDDETLPLPPPVPAPVTDYRSR